MTTANKSATKSPKRTSRQSEPKKSAVKKTAKEADNCWPGYQPVAGKLAGAKGSCEKKETQTKQEKQADSKAAAASKLEKTGQSKGRTKRG